MSSLLAIFLAASADAKPPGVLKALTAQFDPATPARATLDAMRAQVTAIPVDGAIAFAISSGQVLRLFPENERAAVVTEAMGYLDTAATSDASRIHDIEAARGLLFVASGDTVSGEAALRRSLAAKSNLTALSALLDLVPAETASLCAAYSASASDRFALIDICVAHGDALAWVTPADLSAWRADQERRAAAAAQRAAEEQARLSAMFSSPPPAPSSAPAPPAPSAPAIVSVSIHSNCKSTVRVFFGEKPRYSSGTTTTISSNSVSSYSLRPGSLIWIVDGSDRPLSSTSVGSSGQRIEISPTCTGFGAY